MIPIRDSIKPKNFPFVNITLIFLNFLIFIYEITLSRTELAQFFYEYGLIPANISALNLISSTFLHGGWFHVLGNMLFLWVFGDNVEDRLGHFKYFIFYLFVGFVGNIAHVFSDPTSTTPLVGASGAIAGVLGAYFLLFPKSKILTFIPFLFFFLVEIPAIIFLFLWFVMQLFNGVLTLGVTGNTTAWWAHIGGFIGGVGYTILRARRRKNYY